MSKMEWLARPVCCCDWGVKACVAVVFAGSVRLSVFNSGCECGYCQGGSLIHMFHPALLTAWLHAVNAAGAAAAAG